MIRLGISLMLLLSVGNSAWAASAREILDEAKRLDDTERHWTDRTQRMTLHIFDRRGRERVRTLRSFDRRGEKKQKKAIAFFESPPEIKDTAFLQWSYPDRDDSQWLYLPELGRVRQITARARSESFMGTDFSYRDLEIMSEMIDWTEDQVKSRLTGEASVDGLPCHVISLTPRKMDIGYSKIVVWMSGNDYLPRKIELYDDDEPVKRLKLSSYENQGAIPTATHLEMENLRRGTRTVVDVSDVAYNTGLSDSLFTKRGMKHPPR